MDRAWRCRHGDDRQHPSATACSDLSDAYRWKARLAYDRHGLSDRSRYMGRGLCRDGRCHECGATRAWWWGFSLFAVSSAGTSCLSWSGERILFSQQQRCRGRAPAAEAWACGYSRRRCSSRQRHPGHLLRISRRADDFHSCRPGAILSVRLGICAWARRGRRSRREPQHSTAARHQGWRLHAGAWRRAKSDLSVRTGSAGGRAGPGCIGEWPARGPRCYHRRLPAHRGGNCTDGSSYRLCAGGRLFVGSARHQPDVCSRGFEQTR